MKAASLAQIRQAIGGKSARPLPAQPPMISDVSTDTRTITKGSLFVALRGEHHDAHDYLPAAVAAGAVAAIVDRIPPSSPEIDYLIVPDTRRALGKLATMARKHLRAKVIAVGGSNGKTGTKLLIHAALSSKLKGDVSPKSFNNDIGVPLTILPAGSKLDYLVLEMGTNHPGEIKRLSQMALPDIAVITCAAAEHLEGLGDLAGVRKEEASITTGLSASGLLVVNGDDPALLEATAGYGGKRLTFGFERTNDLYATDVHTDTDGVWFKLNGRKAVRIPLLGRHVAANALAAIAVGRRLGLEEEAIIDNLSRATGPEMRLQLQRAGAVTILNDAYNANPSSMQAAVATLVELTGAQRRIAVLGDMREMGAAADDLHREMGRFVADKPLDLLICVGEKSALIAESARAAGFAAAAISHYPDSAAAAPAVAQLVREGDLLLLKGSRALKLERIAEALSSAGRGDGSEARKIA